MNATKKELIDFLKEAFDAFESDSGIVYADFVDHYLAEHAPVEKKKSWKPTKQKKSCDNCEYDGRQGYSNNCVMCSFSKSNWKPIK